MKYDINEKSYDEKESVLGIIYDSYSDEADKEIETIYQKSELFDEIVDNLYYQHKEGKYIFSHSGGVSWKPIEEQTIDQLLWSKDFRPRKDGLIHVCGHTPTSSGQVENHNNMLLCDVGAIFKDIDLPFIKLED